MSPSQEIKILLVEDNPRDAELTLRALQQNHVANQIVHVDDGQKALDWLHGVPAALGREPDPIPKVVLLDLKLPKISGLEVLAAIRSHPRTHRLPVVVLTSSREEQDVVESYKLGVNSYIVKPVEFENFAEAVIKAGIYWLIINEPPP